MNDILVDVLQAIVSHATNQEPGANVWVLINGERILTLTTTVDVQGGEVAGELTPVLGNQSPLREFFLLGPFDIEAADLVSSKLEPVHVIGQVEHKVILFGILLEKLTLSHQVLLGILGWLRDHALGIKLLTTKLGLLKAANMGA